MDPVDLTDDEHLALVALLRHMAMADGEISGKETDELQALGMELGGGRFLAAWNATSERTPNAQAALDYAADHVARVEARELIVTMLTDLAGTDRPHPSERALLGKVRLMWGMFTP